MEFVEIKITYAGLRGSMKKKYKNNSIYWIFAIMFIATAVAILAWGDYALNPFGCVFGIVVMIFCGSREIFWFYKDKKDERNSKGKMEK